MTHTKGSREADASGGIATLPIESGTSGTRTVPRLRLTITEGAPSGRSFVSTAERLSIGSDAMNDVHVIDPTASRFHCELRIEPDGVRVVDLESSNGTFIAGMRVRDAYVAGDALIRVGRTVLRLDFAGENSPLECSSQARFGSLLGRSAVMRSMFALLERVAPTNATVLLEGETGVGKGQAAESIHRASARRHGPFVVVDCGAMPAPLLEAELYGHEKGAFTGAQTRRVGAFEAANGGTVFLDEIGDLPSELQPKLLRVLENRHVRRLGSNAYVPVDVRVVAATNRDLRTDVNAGRFRADLFFRLAVVKILLPPLRARPDDLPSLAAHILSQLGASPEMSASLVTPAFLQELTRASWPGNVRELRNFLERGLIFPEGAHDTSQAPVSGVAGVVPYAQAKEQALARFEQEYVQSLLRAHGGHVVTAAAASGLSREYVYRLMRRHQIVA